MSVVNSLLAALVRLDGDALVMHVGEKPYVVTTSESLDAFRGPLAWGQVELATRRLTVEAVSGLIRQLLPPEEQRALTDFGALEYELLPNPAVPGRFTVIAARGGDDIWLEIRYHRPPRPKVSAEPKTPPPAPAAAVPAAAPVASAPPVIAQPRVESPAPITAPPIAAPEVATTRVEAIAEPKGPPTAGEPIAAPEAAAMVSEPVAAPPVAEEPVAPVASVAQGPVVEPAGEEVEIEISLEEAPEAAAAVAAEAPAMEAGGPALEAVPLEIVDVPQPATVVPLVRPVVRVGAVAPAPIERSRLDRLLRVAAARGASVLYIVTESPPVIRVDGEITVLEAEEKLGAAEVSAMLMELAPEPTREALQSGEVTEWIRDVADVGRVRCMSFRDHRGPGGLLRMLPARALSVEQLGLSRTIQALCGESEGLVLVTGPRASGKSTLVSAFVDLINRTRADHVITLESQIVFVHESRRSFVSQRELRGTGEDLATAARAALRENPDVLVIEDLRSPELISVALDAAESGLLVFAAVPAAGATAALEKVIDQFPSERRAHAQTALAGTLRAVVAQVLARKIGGGRVAAREVLLNTRAVAALIAEGKTFQLPLALESGHKAGMVPLNDALAGFVRSAAIDPAEAYRKTYDREGLLAQLRREGVDTSFVERLA